MDTFKKKRGKEKMNKKMISALIAGILCMGTLSACSNTTKTADNTRSKLQITTSIYPEYEWVNAVLGSHQDEANVTLLMQNGVDLHSYQPSTQDILTVKNSDLFIYVGGESDGWAVDASKDAKNQNFRSIDLMDLLKDIKKQEVAKEGMQKDADDDGEIEYDEHVWLSLRNAEKIVKDIADQFCLTARKSSGFPSQCRCIHQTAVSTGSKISEDGRQCTGKDLGLWRPFSIPLYGG